MAARTTEGASSAAVKHGRATLGAFDALVRAVRSASAAPQGLAARALEAHRAHDNGFVKVEALGLSLAGDRLGGDEASLRWTLPIFLAGVRGFRPALDCTADDLVLLAERFVRTEATAEGARALQDWIFSDGATGVDVDLAPSFVEAFEASESMALGSTSAILAIRAKGLDDGSGAVLAVDELDRAASLETLSVEVDLYEKRVAARELELSGAAMTKVAKDADDPAGWLDLELALRDDGRPGVVTAHVHDRRAARLFRQRAAFGADTSFVTRWIAAASRVEVGGALRAALLGTAFLRELGVALVDDAADDALAFAHAQGPEPATAVAAGYLDRPKPLPSAPIAALAERAGALEALAPALGERGLERLVLNLHQRPDVLAFLAKGAPVSVALTVAERKPSRAWLDALGVRAGELDATQLTRFLGLAVQTASASAMTSGVLARRANDIAPDALARALRALVGAGEGLQVVEIARSRSAVERVRIAALLVTIAVPALRASVLRFRWMELLDPGEFAYELKRARAVAQGKRP